MCDVCCLDAGGAGPECVMCAAWLQVEQVLNLAETSWQFDTFRLDAVTGGHPLSTLAYFLFVRCGFVEQFSLDKHKLARCGCHVRLSRGLVCPPPSLPPVPLQGMSGCHVA